LSSWLLDTFEDFEALLDENELVEEPVDLDTFLTDPYYLGGAKIKKISDVQRQIIEGISQIYKLSTLVKLHGEEEGNRIWNDETYHEVVAMCGKGGGKDFSSRIGFAYTIYKLHCLRDPIEYYDKAHGTYIDLLNIAINAEQAMNVFFNPLKNILMASPYFQEMGFEPRKATLEFNSSPIRLFSGNSEAESWEGLDLLLVVLDEIAAFKVESQFQKGNAQGAQRLSAAGIYDMSKNSVISRFGDIGKVILLSFPRFSGDFICQRYEETMGDPTVLRIKAPTWVMNPFKTREDFEPQFKRNRVQAEMRFGCNPPEMIDAFFRDPTLVRKGFRGNWELKGEGSVDEKWVLHENEDLIPVDEQGRFKDWFKCLDDHMRFIHVDLALKRDRAALCMVHSPGMRKIEVETGLWEPLPVLKMDLIYYWEAQDGQEIDFSQIREMVKLLANKFPVAQVTFDRWQSADTIQILNKRGIYCDNHSVKKNDYETLSTAIYDGRFSGYFNHILVEEEMLKLQVMPNGKIDHPDGFHDDGAQCLASAVWNASQFADLETEIEISVLGDADDWEALELLEAQEDDRKKDGRVRPHAQLTAESEFEFEIQAI
jgi:hypothetical protein